MTHPLRNYLEYRINEIQEEIDKSPEEIDLRLGQIKAYKDILNIFGFRDKDE